MNISYDLNLAIVYACMLAVVSFGVFHLAPPALRAIFAAIAFGVQSLVTRLRRSGPGGGAMTQTAPAPQHWWGPHSSQ